MKLLTLAAIGGFCIGCTTARHAAIGGFGGFPAVEYAAKDPEVMLDQKEDYRSFVYGAGSGLNAGLTVFLFFINPVVGITYISVGATYGVVRLQERQNSSQ